MFLWPLLDYSHLLSDRRILIRGRCLIAVAKMSRAFLGIHRQRRAEMYRKGQRPFFDS